MVGGLISLLSTTIGATLVFAGKNKRFNPMSVLTLDFAIGMMLAASALSLISPAYSSLPRQDLPQVGMVTLSLLGGILFITVLGKILELSSGQSSRAAVFVIAMMLHNLPEGLAAGAGSNSVLGAIALQNIPEGMTTALAFVALGLSVPAAFLGAFASGLVEMIGGFGGEWATAQTQTALPFILAFAGGAMMSATLRELWERCQENGWSILAKKEFLMGGLLIWGMNVLTGA